MLSLGNLVSGEPCMLNVFLLLWGYTVHENTDVNVNCILEVEMSPSDILQQVQAYTGESTRLS